jgi:hypothetical protein
VEAAAAACERGVQSSGRGRGWVATAMAGGERGRKYEAAGDVVKK